MAEETSPPLHPSPAAHSQNTQLQIASLQAQIGVFRGPLPPPEVLKRYNEIFDGCAERIVRMAEEQAHHRQHLEKTVIESNAYSQKHGMTYGFVLCGIALIGGLALLALDKSIAGYTVLLTDLGSFAAATLYLRWFQKRERIEKSTPTEQPSMPSSQPPMETMVP